MKYVIVVLTVIILSLSASTAYFKRLHTEAIGYIGVCTESLSNTSKTLQICQSDARLNDTLGVQLDNNIQESVSVYDKYSSILKRENDIHVGGVDETNEVGLSDTLPSGVSRLLNEAYNELYPSEERTTKDIHKQ